MFQRNILSGVFRPHRSIPGSVFRRRRAQGLTMPASLGICIALPLLPPTTMSPGCTHGGTEPRSEMISFVCPTKNRPERHEHLWRQYVQQTVFPKELLVGDDSKSPSTFFRRLGDPSVRYLYSPEELTLGDKRNRLNSRASGDVIVHLDDDDHYAPDYARHMLERLRGHNLARLSAFRVLDERDGSLYECDALNPATARQGKLIGARWNGVRVPAWLSRSSAALRWGYGFSYVYQKALWAKVHFDKSMTLREDVDFVKRCLREGALVRQVDDGAHLATHVVHGASTSTAFTTAKVTRMLISHTIGHVVGGGVFGFAFGHAVDRTILQGAPWLTPAT